MYEVQNQSSIFYVFFFIDLSSVGVGSVTGFITAVDVNIGGDAITTATEDRGMVDRLYGSTGGFIYLFLNHKASMFLLIYLYSIPKTL